MERDRETLVDVLRQQNAAWGNDSPPVRQHIAALGSADAVAVVSGQQLGLFGGPLYTVYKAVTAVQLARRAQRQLGREVVPVFWLADEDHDWEEVRSAVVVLDDEPYGLSLPGSASREPVGRRMLGDEVPALLQELDRVLPQTEFTPDLLESLRDAWRPGRTVRDAFARWMTRLFAGTGLVLISGDDRRLKHLAAHVVRREIEDPAASLAALLEPSERLGDESFHRQITPLAGQLFLMEPAGRMALDPQREGSFSLRHSRKTYGRDELLSFLAQEPERFSPNVVLRPIVEDYLLPTMAYVAGPGEASYYAQLRGVYDLFGVPMPIIYPRASVALIEPKVRRVLERYRLSIEDLENGSDEVVEALHARLAVAEPDQPIDESFRKARDLLQRAAEVVRPTAEKVDGSLGRSTESLRQRLINDLEIVERKVIRARKRNHEQIGIHLRKAAAHLVPTRRPQERILSPVHFLNRYGPALVARLIETLDLDTSEQQVIEL